MMGRRLMTPDELKAMPRGSFITMKTGMHPIKTKFQLFLKWGITFGEAYQLEEHTARKVEYASKEELITAIFKKYPPKKAEIEQEPFSSRREAVSRRLDGCGNPHGPRTD